MRIPDPIPLPAQGDTSRFEEYEMGNMPEGLNEAIDEQEKQRQARANFEEERRIRALARGHEHVKQLLLEKGGETYNRNQERYKADLSARVTEELRIARYLLSIPSVED